MSRRVTGSSSRRGYADLLMVLALLVAAARFSAPFAQWVDLKTDDAAEYQARGRRLTWTEVPDLDPAWSPLYLVWYRLLAAAVPDPVALYDANWRLLGALLPVALYALWRGQGAAPWAAALAAWFFLVSEADWQVRMRVTGFALLVLSAVWALAARARVPAARAWWMAWGLLGPVALARPEFFVAGVGALVLAVGAWARARRLGERPERPAWLLGPLLTLGLWALWGLPWSGGRLAYAFGQHYAYNRVRCGGEASTPAWEEVVRRDFGALVTPWQGWRRNPAAMLAHGLCNLRQAPRALARLALRTAGPLPRRWMAGLPLLAVALRMAVIGRKRTWGPWPTGVAVGLWLVVAAPLAAALVLISGRETHYLQMALFWAYLPLGAWLLPRTTARPALLWLAALAVGLVAVTPTLAGFAYGRQPPPQYNRATVAALQAAPWRDDLPAIRLNGTRPVAHYFLIDYLSDPRFVEVPYAPEEGFLDYIRAQRPDAIVIHLPRFHGDASWQAFAADPAAFGYRAQYILDEQRVLYLREAALTR